MIISLSVFALICSLSQAATNSSGCGKTLSSELTQGGTGESNSLSFTTSSKQDRSYLLHIPTGYDANTATPLIFAFHGRFGTGSGQEQLSKLSHHAWNPDHMVVYPDGLKEEWQGDPDAQGFDDVGFVLELLDHLESKYCIDTSRVYATGMSNGGGFSLNILACNATASKKFAAFASNSGAYYQGSTDVGCNPDTVSIPCSPGRTGIPILDIHGAADDVIPYYGGSRRDRCLPTIPRFVSQWAERDGLSSNNVSTSLYGGHVKKQEFGASSGQQGLVTHYWVEGLGHTWVSKSIGSYFNATPVMLSFFRNYTLDSASQPETNKSSISHSSATNIVTTSSSTIDSSTSAAAASGTTESLHCPSANNLVYHDANGHKYYILCAYYTSGPPIESVSYLGSFAKCIESCDSTSGCKSVSYYKGACYLKGDDTPLVETKDDANKVAFKLT